MDTLTLIVFVLVIFWLGGMGYGGLMLGGGLIHLLIVIALILFVFRLLNSNGRDVDV